MKHLFRIIFVILLILSANSLSYSQSSGSSGQQQNTVTFSTFAAAPIAHYQSILFHPNDNLSNPCAPGTMFFSASQNDLLYCQDSGNGTGSFSIVGGGLWKKIDNDIFLKDTAINSDLQIGIGTSTPETALDVFGNVRFQGGNGNLLWGFKNSHLSFGNITLTSGPRPQIGINLGLANSPSVDAANRMAVVGGDVIIGSTTHLHNNILNTALPAPPAIGINPAVFTVVGDSDFVGRSYFHDDALMENDLFVLGNLIAPNTTNTFGSISAASISVGTLTASKICVQSCGNPMFELFIDGDIFWTGSSGSSDGRFKTNLQPITGALETIAALNPVKYQWKKLGRDESEKIVVKDEVDPAVHLGMIAQDVYKIIPEVVHKPMDEDKNLWKINYEELVPVLIQAIKEQQFALEALKSEIEALKKEFKKSP